MEGGGAEEMCYTLSEVSEHNSINDCWLVISGIVYNVTKFMDDHPGGDEVLLAATGKDATEDFEDVGHSTTAKTMMEEFRIGTLNNDTTLPEKKNVISPTTFTSTTNHTQEKKKPMFIIKIMQFLLPLIIIGMAIGIRSYSKLA